MVGKWSSCLLNTRKTNEIKLNDFPCFNSATNLAFVFRETGESLTNEIVW